MAQRQTGGRLRAALFLLISLGAAVLASLVIYTVITNYRKELVTALEEQEKTIPVMVAKTHLHQGKTIIQEDLDEIALPPDYVPDSVLRQPEQALGRVPRERILAKEFIREERLADPEAGIGLNAIIPRGMRAISINISGGSAVSGFLNPGNYVDILVTLRPTGEGELAQTLTLLQAITVLAVDNRLGTGAAEQKGAGQPSVTLAVTPDDAEKLTHANAQGILTLTLRNDIDVTHQETHGAQVDALLGGKTEEKRMQIKEWKETVAPQLKRTGTVTIIKGGRKEKQKVKTGN